MSSTLNILTLDIIDEKVNKTTVERYFSLFAEAALRYYKDLLNTCLFDKEVELDETHLWRRKVSKAPARAYKNGSLWIFGIE